MDTNALPKPLLDLKDLGYQFTYEIDEGPPKFNYPLNYPELRWQNSNSNLRKIPASSRFLAAQSLAWDKSSPSLASISLYRMR
ncbi:MAG: hypothetical protein P8Y14_15585 [Anaerolineales bacterium]